MPYIHYEHFNKQKKIRKIIHSVDKSKITANNARRNAPRRLSRNSRNPWSEVLGQPQESGQGRSLWSSDEEGILSLSMPLPLSTRPTIPALQSNTSESSLIEAYLHHEPPLHVRRSLDEFYYSSLTHHEIIDRDRNQIVFKSREEEELLEKKIELMKAYYRRGVPSFYVPQNSNQYYHSTLLQNRTEERDLNEMEHRLREEGHIRFGEKRSQQTLDLLPGSYLWTGPEHEHQESDKRMGTRDKGLKTEDYPILMVDQLWMWIIGNGEHLGFASGFAFLTSLDTLITSFPESYTHGKNSSEKSKGERKTNDQFPTTASIRDIIDQHLKKYDARSPIKIRDFASLIINSCAGFLDRYRDPPDIPILDIFDQTINRAVSDHRFLFLPPMLTLLTNTVK